MDDPNIRKGVAAIMFSSFLMMLLNSIGIALLVVLLDLHHWFVGLNLGLLTGLLFACTSIAINMLYEKNLSIIFINGGYQLLVNIIAAATIAEWR